MYLFNKCSCPDCQKTAITEFDDNGNFIEAPGYCWEHTENKLYHAHRLLNYIQTHDKIVGLSACGMSIHDVNIESKKFYGCNMQNCNFTNMHGGEMRARMCMFDNSTFSDCDFLNSNIQFSSFSGSKFIHVLLTGSDLIHNNFNGLMSYQCSFDDSDLYNSHFIKSQLLNTSFKNCNLKKVIFYEAQRQDVSFKMSNTREAFFLKNKKGITILGDEELPKS